MPQTAASLRNSLRTSLRTTASAMSYHARTIYLFTKSDLITTLIPVTCFAFGAAPLSRSKPLSHALEAVFWMWIHLLGFNLCNQARGSITEDQCNKPWRPLPSGRITMDNAITLKYFVLALCMIISYGYGLPVFYSSVFLWFCSAVYHEGYGDQHYISKGILNGLGYSCFAMGEMLIAASNRSKVDYIQFLSVVLMCCVIASTIQAQDFQDYVGDKKMGRQTINVAYPKFSRYTTFMTFIPWSFFLSSVWDISLFATISYATFATIISLRFYLFRTASADKTSYFMYNIWLAIAFALPGYWRWQNQSSNWVSMPAYSSFPFSCCTYIM